MKSRQSHAPAIAAAKAATVPVDNIDNAITRTMSRTIITHGCTQMMVTSMLIFGGVFERFPKLKLVCVEADAGWAPHFAYKMDHAFDITPHWLGDVKLSKLPSEYFWENVYMTFQEDNVILSSIQREQAATGVVQQTWIAIDEAPTRMRLMLQRLLDEAMQLGGY